MEASSNVSVQQDTGSRQKQKKKGRPRYTVLDLSENINTETNKKVVARDNVNEESKICGEEIDNVESDNRKGDTNDISFEDIEDIDHEEDIEDRRKEKKDKDQDYNIFVKTHQKRSNCTSKRSKRQRNDSG